MTEGLSGALGLTEPGIVDLDYRWIDDDWKASPMSWSRRSQNAGATSQNKGDTRNERVEEPVYQNEADRIAAEAVDPEQQCLVCLGLPN